MFSVFVSEYFVTRLYAIMEQVFRDVKEEILREEGDVTLQPNHWALIFIIYRCFRVRQSSLRP